MPLVEKRRTQIIHNSNNADGNTEIETTSKSEKNDSRLDGKNSVTGNLAISRTQKIIDVYSTNKANDQLHSISEEKNKNPSSSSKPMVETFFGTFAI